MKVAYVSPMPPERSGIADYSALLVPALGRRVELAVVKRGRTKPERGTDVALYHVGNDPEHHGWIVEALRRRPGVVVLHDFVLHHLVAGLTIGRGNGHGYLDAMEREGGVVGRLLAHGVLDKRIPALWESRASEFHLAGEVLSLATALIVHSRYVEHCAREAGYAGPIHVVPHPAWPAPDVAAADVEGAPLYRMLRLRQRVEARPAAARGLRARARPPRGCAAAPRRGDVTRASISTGGSSGSGSMPRACCASHGSTRRGSGR